MMLGINSIAYVQLINKGLANDTRGAAEQTVFTYSQLEYIIILRLKTLIAEKTPIAD